MPPSSDDETGSAGTGPAPALTPTRSTSQDDGAPRYPVASRDLSAVEIPAVVRNVDRAIKAFGRVPSLTHALDPTRNSIPLYLNPESPFCNPIMSHNAVTHNVVLKVTVPKRTGRKRKRGSNEPWQGDVDVPDAEKSPKNDNVCSVARLDEPKVMRRKLQDNVGRYNVDAVGVINHTHRFRGLADFYWDMNTSSFTKRYVDQVLPGNVNKMREFKIEPGTDKGPNVDIIPPPIFTHMGLPFNYHYSQNPYVRTNAEGETINTTAVKQIGYFIGADDPAPAEPQEPPDETDERFMEVMAELQSAFQKRPIWTRRSLLNHLHGKLENWNELKKYLNYAAYQFKGGPWRDCVVPYGVDPRTDSKYRIYQTLMFKLTKHKQPQGKDALTAFGPGGEPIQDSDYQLSSHIFDGETYNTDGKVWQVCDITDPLLRELLDNASVRQTWDVGSGWYHGGLWAKVKAIMKTKLVAIRFNRTLSRQDFAATLNFGDKTPPRSASANLHLPLPNLRLSNDELTVLRGRKPPKKKSQGYNVKLYGRSKEVSQADDQTSMVSSPTRAPDDGAMSNEEGDLDRESDEEGNETDVEDDFGGDDDGQGEFGDYQGGYGDDGSDVDAMHDNVQYSEYPELD